MYAYQRQFKPVHIEIIRLHWSGLTNLEIAAKLGLSVMTISNVLTSEGAQRILAQMSEGVLNTMAEVQQDLQAAAVQAIEKKIDLLKSDNDVVANKAATDVLLMAGHAPTKHVHITGRTEADKRYDGLTEDEIRQKLLEELGETGPDGSLLN